MVYCRDVRVRRYLNYLVNRFFSPECLSRNITIIEVGKAAMPVLFFSYLAHVTPVTIDVAFRCEVVLQQHISNLKVLAKDCGHEGSLGF